MLLRKEKWSLLRKGQIASPVPYSGLTPPLTGNLPGLLVPAPGTFHVAAYTASVTNVANADMAALTDNIIPIQNGHFLPSFDSSILWIWAGGTTLSRVRLNSPKFRQINPRYIHPIDNVAIPANNPNTEILPWGELVARGYEELICEYTGNSTVSTRGTVVLALGANRVPVPQGDRYWFRVTSTTAAVANTWTQIALTFETTPPVGTYAVVGGFMQSTNGQAFRLIFDGQYYRPGQLMEAALTNRLDNRAYDGRWGVWGYFRTTNLPRCEVLVNGTDNSYEGYLEVIRVA